MGWGWTGRTGIIPIMDLESWMVDVDGDRWDEGWEGEAPREELEEVHGHGRPH